MIAESGDEESNDDLMCGDGMGVEWGVCRPVWVRSRSKGSFPVDYRHFSVDDCPIGETNPLVWTVAKCPAVDNVIAYVRTDRSWNTWSWNNLARYYFYNKWPNQGLYKRIIGLFLVSQPSLSTTHISMIFRSFCTFIRYNMFCSLWYTFFSVYDMSWAWK